MFDNNKYRMSEFNLTNYAIMKSVRFLSCFMSIQIATNYMSQIYTENVLVNDSDPPKLVNLILLFAIIDVIINAIILAILFGFQKPLSLSIYDFKIYIIEYGIILVSLLVQMYVISSTMYSKKYFLYKDDGLRAIRALSSMFNKFAALYYAVPFGFICKNVI